MARYQYFCHHCRKTTDIIKPMSEYDRDEYCEKCKGKLERNIPKDFGITVNVTGFYGRDSK